MDISTVSTRYPFKSVCLKCKRQSGLLNNHTLNSQVVQSMTSAESHPGFPPVSLKLPPPSHPPAVQMHTSNLSSYSPLPSSFPPPPGSPASLHLRLEEAHLQLRAMEKERKRAEAALARHHPGLSRLPGSTAFPSVGSGAPRLPPHPSRLDRLVVDSWREHSRVLALLERMTKVHGAPQHPGISASFQGWQEAVLALAELRRGLVGEVSLLVDGRNMCVYFEYYTS